ncbi:hypothetical protein PPEP_a3878 [Pseudoalteromonas peptidolytica F12-50-A1]|uniref:Uncharacterized protein n=1 Tax=Pseudoalteromonas peptidolytica F12-50-A1 TaxID=1315280 RepID=A0A8I0MVH1_9GAMM|nr:hypothetical protein [Pseudoalteromonas peptidolytica F12-50-A1]
MIATKVNPCFGGFFIIAEAVVDCYHLFSNKAYLYQFDLILAQFEGVNLALIALKISYLEQLNNKIFA